MYKHSAVGLGTSDAIGISAECDFESGTGFVQADQASSIVERESKLSTVELSQLSAADKVGAIKFLSN